MTPYYSKDGIVLYCGDNREILPELGKFDLLLTDPPYGLGSSLHSPGYGTNEWKKQFGDGAPEWDSVPVDFTMIKECLLSATESIIWGGNYYELRPVRCWLAWDKMQEHTSGHFEMAWTTLDKPTRMFRMCRAQAYGNGKLHPTQKPIALMQWCLNFVPDAQTILDPFAGSGTTLLAAKLEGRQCTGIEINEDYCRIAVERLKQGVFNFAEAD